MDHATPQAKHQRKEEIFKIAEDYAKEVGFLPGDRIEPLVEREGGTIEYVSALERIDEKDGSLYVDGPRDFRIRLSAFTGPERDRFTIAHELGHYVLHSERGTKRIRACRFGSNRVEWEANWFAAAFLMPETDFAAACARHKGDPALIAARYLVSPKAAEVRMTALGLSFEPRP